MLIPIGTSTKPERLIFPAKAKTLVPLLFSVPYLAYSWAPFKMIHGTLGKGFNVIDVGWLFQRPLAAGNGGRLRGMPRSPSTEAISAVSSPQTKAPAPSLM